ncbi:hypothetical protein IAT40_004951 [Kwoniella sp. CBS 6097]
MSSDLTSPSSRIDAPSGEKIYLAMKNTIDYGLSTSGVEATEIIGHYWTYAEAKAAAAAEKQGDMEAEDEASNDDDFDDEYKGDMQSFRVWVEDHELPPRPQHKRLTSVPAPASAPESASAAAAAPVAAGSTSLISSASREEPIWHVFREFIDEAQRQVGITLQSSHWSFNEAKEAVRANLAAECPREYFARLREIREWNNDALGKFGIEAVGTNGEHIIVLVRPNTVPLQPLRGSPAQPLTDITNATRDHATRALQPQRQPLPQHAPIPAPTINLAPPLPGKVYIIVESTTEHHTDRQGRTKVRFKFAYTSCKEANAAAYKVYSKKHPGACEEECDDESSETRCFHGEKRAARGKIDTWYIDVKEMDLVVSKVKQPRGWAKRASTGGPGLGPAAAVANTTGGSASKKQRNSLSGASATAGGSGIVDLTGD